MIKGWKKKDYESEIRLLDGTIRHSVTEVERIEKQLVGLREMCEYLTDRRCQMQDCLSHLPDEKAIEVVGLEMNDADWEPLDRGIDPQ